LAARVAVGLSTLFAAAPALQRIWQALVVHVVPLVVTSPALTPRYGFSSHHLKGYVFLSFPAGEAVKDTIEDSLSLAHELGHQVLMAYQTADPVLASDQDAPVYSAIRRGFRPAILALHGAMALGYMTYTAECLGSAAARGYRDGLRRTLLGMRAAGCIYTELGSLLVSELEELAWP
jgi:HEXXH motif-containing protein